jgi:3-deoxy-manno-octulosonate cytidylyltransferase (CMP-KDO synthetase)
MRKPDVLILIPARMAATRLPGKPLADIAGKPMIEHVIRRAEAAGLGEVIVATDSEPILAAVEKAGCRALMTRADHASGSDRIFEALEIVDPDRKVRVVVNVQGDLPTLNPHDIRSAVNLLDDPEIDIATLGVEITTEYEWESPSVVKLGGKYIGPNHISARIFTREVSPLIAQSQKREDELPSNMALLPGAIFAFSRPKFYHHIGLYAYRREALTRFVQLPQSESEKREKLEQLRAMDAGMRIDAAIVVSVPLGVDTPDDLETARRLLSN